MNTQKLGKIVTKELIVNGMAIHVGYQEVIENNEVVGYIDLEGCFVSTSDEKSGIEF